MRLRMLPALAAFTLLSCAAAALAQEQKQEQKQEQQVIDDFVTTRGVSFDGPAKKPQKQVGQASPPRKGTTSGKGSSGSVASGKGAGGKGAATVKSNKAAPTPSGGGAGALTAGTADESPAPRARRC